MTTTRNMIEKCAVCGAESEQTILTSTNAFGSWDLYLRPPGMQKDTMNYWVQECPQCGYVAENIKNPAAIDPRLPL